MLAKLSDSDTLMVTELIRLRRSTSKVIALINELIQHNIRVIVSTQNLDIARHGMNSKIIVTPISLFAEQKRDLVSLRTQEALAALSETERAQAINRKFFRSGLHSL